MSLWEKNIEKKHHYSKLEENKIVDTLIIGGGMTGLQTLYYMKDQEKVCLVEALEIGSGVSKNTTAKINYLQENTLFSLWKEGKKEKAISYLAATLYGMQLLLDILDREDISCDFERVTSFLVTREEKNVALLKQFKTFLEAHNITLTEDFSTILEPFLYGIGVRDTFVFHPMKYMEELAHKISCSVYEHTKIIRMKKGETDFFCYTDSGYCIRAKHVIIACHYPFFLFPFFMPLKSSIEKSYLVARKVKENLGYTYITVESPSLSSRFYEDGDNIYQICLGASHDISVHQEDKKNFDNVLQAFQISMNEIDCLWSNTDLITQDHLPYIGRVTSELFLATGYQTWGMIGSVLGAKILADALQNKKNDYASLFDPKRIGWKQVEQWITSMLKNGFSFTKSMYYPKSWYSKNLSFSFECGTFVATFKDHEGEHKVHPVCPHMKCGLIFNEEEKTWDCPCHSSRFDKDGKCIQGPSKYSIVLKSQKEK